MEHGNESKKIIENEKIKYFKILNFVSRRSTNDYFVM